MADKFYLNLLYFEFDIPRLLWNETFSFGMSI